MKLFLTLSACCVLFGALSCKKENKSPIEQLPPATKNGKNTFGCLVNGQAWLPKGSFPLGNLNPVLSYDPNFENGALMIYAYQVGNSRKFGITISGKNINKEGVYHLAPAGSDAPQGVMVTDSKGGCEYFLEENGTECTGTLEITKLAFAEKIIAGTFSFTISTPGCETLKVTDGRFDLRLY